MNRVLAVVQSPTGRKVGIGVGVAAIIGGIGYGVNHFIGRPLRAAGRAAKEAFNAEREAQAKEEAEAAKKTD